MSPASGSGKHKRTSETQQLKERIEKLKAEIKRTKEQKDLRPDDRIRGDRNSYGPGTLPQSPPPHLAYRPPADRLLQVSEVMRSRDSFHRDVDVLPQQAAEYTRGAAADVSREVSRGDRSTDDLRGEMPAAAGMQFTQQEPRSR